MSLKRFAVSNTVVKAYSDHKTTLTVYTCLKLISRNFHSLVAILETPSGQKIEPTITPLDEPGKYEIAYEPVETGNHKLNVKYGKDHVKDSPFRLRVAPSGDASKVKVSGEGIEKPRVGQLVDIIFDTTEAGKGKIFFQVLNRKVSKLSYLDGPLLSPTSPQHQLIKQRSLSRNNCPMTEVIVSVLTSWRTALPRNFKKQFFFVSR